MDEELWQRAILAAAFQRLRDRVQPDNFSVYLALVEEDKSPAELARRYGKTVNNIYRIRNSCRTMLEEEAGAIRELWGQLGQLPC
jgi:hypothetical protein